MRPKGNILIIVLFLLIASSLFAVLLAQQARSLLKTVYGVHDYYQAYYQAYAGIELGFAQQLFHGYGYEELLTFPNPNLPLPWDQTKVHISSKSSILGSSSSSWWCDQPGSYQVLAWWSSFIIPLFYDSSQWFEIPNYTNISSVQLNAEYQPFLSFQWTPWNTLFLKVIDEQLLNYNAQWSLPVTQELQKVSLSFVQYDSTDTTNKNYFIIANPGDSSQTFSFCLNFIKPMVNTTVSIESLANYHTTQVGLYGTRQFQVPGFLTYGTIQ